MKNNLISYRDDEMGLNYCPNCKHEISPKSRRCYYCGYQIKEDLHQKAVRTQANRLFYLISILGIIAIILYIPKLFRSHFNGISLVILLIMVSLIMVLGYMLNNRRQISSWNSRINKMPLKSKKRLSVEERYYYKGKTNEQIHQYTEALQCYNKALELNPNFELAKTAKEEIEKLILN